MFGCDTTISLAGCAVIVGMVRMPSWNSAVCVVPLVPPVPDVAVKACPGWMDTFPRDTTNCCNWNYKRYTYHQILYSLHCGEWNYDKSVVPAYRFVGNSFLY